MNKDWDDARVCNNIPRGQYLTFLLKNYKAALRNNAAKDKTAEAQLGVD